MGIPKCLKFPEGQVEFSKQSCEVIAAGDPGEGEAGDSFWEEQIICFAKALDICVRDRGDREDKAIRVIFWNLL